ncbi:LAME_0A05204g1_1 [Lachancea meyersii CBS 8951]|uniref:UDP-N-acetylglucosamine transferase subunit ALG13 n=1 Tax=Lachancea meyersii CBS 8951 TaxID=1266667 RepID=A0A1G4IQ83_9SACH|nr:LAME_0A05204g1_1 [Lachancea meyersii CBS 8951]
MGRTIVVTCGATVPFPKLVEAVLALEFLRTIQQRWQFDRLVVQYGKEYRAVFESQLERLDATASTKRDKISKALGIELEAYGEVANVEICGFSFATNIQKLLRTHADLIVSHAGTGSILDALRLQKPLVVVANTGLMDNHQLQIAARFESRGHLVASRGPTTCEVLAAVAAVETCCLTPLDSGKSAQFSNLLANVAYS